MENKDCCKLCVHIRPDPDKGRYQGYCKNPSCPCHSKAPTDENWRHSYYLQFGYTDFRKENPFTYEAVAEFIASLLQKEREKAYEEGKREKLEDTLLRDSAFAAGKSEAFSLVRKMIEKLPLRALEADMVEDELSILEGK